MAVKITKVDVWAGEIMDQPGGLATVLDLLADAKANIECCIARRQPDRPGSGVVFISPVKGKRAQDAAKMAGLSRADDIATLRVEGPDKPGTGAQLTDAIADAGINMRGLSAMVLGNKFVAYFGFDNTRDADRAAKAMKSAGARRAKARR